ncbi:Ribonuclease H-like domain [Phytophthora cactorum]|nr:Ribonuclease H-like domain [Phytophthora cactorum]
MAALDGNMQPAAALLRNPETRRYSNLDPIGEEQFLEGIAYVGQHVKTIMRSELTDHFGLKLDGWSHNSEHYLAVFVCYELGGQPRCPLLAMAPLVQAPGQDLSAQGHVDFLRDMLSQDYGKPLENCLYLVGDNCTTNRRLAILMGIPLSLLENFKDELAQVRDLMITLKSLNQSASCGTTFIQSICFVKKMANSNTKLRPVLNQATRWSSTFCIVNRYMKLLEFIQVATIWRSIFRRLQQTAQDRSVSKELQLKSVSIADVRSYFDALIELWPEFATYLGPRAAIVHNPHFEAGCVKVQRGESAELTRSEKAALSRFAVLEAVEQPLAADHETTGSFVEQVKKKRKTSTPTATYMLLQSVPHFKHVCQGHLASSQRLQPARLEMICPSHERRAMGRERRQRVLLDWF